MPKEEIAKCACGVAVSVDGPYPDVGYQVECHPGLSKRCWVGPACETSDGAIKAWNRVMEKVNT